MRVFADFDDTWTDHPEIWSQVEAIVTGNSWQNFEKVMEDWVGPRRPIFFNPVEEDEEGLIANVNHKADIIKKCEVDKFFEDQEEQVEMLKILCPNTEIVLVKSEMTFI